MWGDILSPCGSRNLEGNPKGGWQANIKPMYIQISISDSFITGVSLSTLYVQVHDCRLEKSIADLRHPLVFLNLHLLAWATWRRDLSPKPQTIFLKSCLKKRRRWNNLIQGPNKIKLTQFLSLAHFTQSAK